MRIVITDANVIINLATANGMTLLRDLPGHEFILPEEVRDEVTGGQQREQLDRALAEGYLTVRRLESVDGLTLFVELRKTLGAGESACLAMAKVEGCLVASSAVHSRRDHFRDRGGRSQRDTCREPVCDVFRQLQ